MIKYLKEDFIKISGLKIFAYHGVLPEEKEQGQYFFVNARLYYDMHRAATTDALADALNYADCCQYMTDVFISRTYDLIEAAAEHLCNELLIHYPLLSRVDLELSKPHAPIGLPFSDVSVNISRGRHVCYLSVGSNMGNREEYICRAIEELCQHKKVVHVTKSKLIETEPYGPVKQDDFLNCVLRMETILLPEELLGLLHEIEAHAGRKREIHWGPRTLDLDIIFYDDLVYESDDLLIPHVDMQNRSFVLEPLKELAPNFRHPILGLTVSQMLENLGERS